MKKSLVFLLHAAYWMMYLLLVTILILAMRINNAHLTWGVLGGAIFLSPFGLVTMLPGVVGFYSFYHLLFNRFLTTKRIIALVLGGLLLSVAAAAVTLLLVYLIFNRHGFIWDSSTIISIGSFLSFIALAHGVTALVLKGFVNWYNDIKLKADLNKRNYDMEIALVKSQLNPHFLFNTINNIDALISRDPDAASAYLNKLSDIMRFMLYEVKTENILLAKELAYIEKFIELQRIRTTNPHYVNYTVQGDVGHLMIPPMLFIAFVENAFKHTENKKTENAINIHVDIDKNKIVFLCENTFNPHSKLKQNGSGLGSELIKRRLALSYADSHTLTVTNNNDLYKVELSLY